MSRGNQIVVKGEKVVIRVPSDELEAMFASDDDPSGDFNIPLEENNNFAYCMLANMSIIMGKASYDWT